MDMGIAAVIVAVLTTIGGVLVALIQSSRKENKEDHALVVEQLRTVYKAIVKVDEKVDKHLAWHIETKEGNNGAIEGTDRKRTKRRTAS